MKINKFLAIAASLTSVLHAVNSADAQTSALCRQEGNQMELASTCSASYVGGLCTGPFYKNITFKTPFAAPPDVLVTPALVSGIAGCVGYATDKVVCFASKVTNVGFTLFCSGSPEGGSCGGIYDGYLTPAYANWIAVDNSSAGCSASESGHLAAIHSCDNPGGASGDLCGSSFYKQISFSKSYKTTPHVIVAPENVSDHGGCSGGGTDTLYCLPSNVTNKGFKLQCSGSPSGVSCGAGSSIFNSTLAGYLVRESTPSCLVQSSHFIDSDTCSGSLVAPDLCTGQFYKDITFPQPFKSVPQVIVSPEHVSSGKTPCAQGATDFVQCQATNVTTTGFRVLCNGSPIGNECGAANESFYTTAKFGYMAIDGSCAPAQCQDGIDNDGDGLTDLQDPGCASGDDDNEGDATSQCQDGIDNDGDGAIDFPNDFSCSSPQDNDEAAPLAQCQDGIDNDGDGKIDGADGGCSSNQDNSEDSEGFCTQVSSSSIIGEVDQFAVELANRTKEAADLLSKNAKAIGKTASAVRALKTDAQRAKNKADSFVQEARNLLLQFPEVSRFCPNANVLCSTVDRSATIKQLQALYSQQLAATKRITARAFFNKTGSTLKTRTNAIVLGAKDAFDAGNASLAKLPAVATECK